MNSVITEVFPRASGYHKKPIWPRAKNLFPRCLAQPQTKTMQGRNLFLTYLSRFSSLPWSRLWKIIVYLATSAGGLTTFIFCISTLQEAMRSVVRKTIHINQELMKNNQQLESSSLVNAVKANIESCKSSSPSLPQPVLPEK